MTDTAVEPDMWVPRLGDPSIPEAHAELIRGLYRLAAWVADHPEVPAPRVDARVYASGGPGWDAECRFVDRVALALGVAPEYRADGDHYTVGASFGPVNLRATAISAEHMARWQAVTSYDGSVEPAEHAAAGGELR